MACYICAMNRERFRLRENQAHRVLPGVRLSLAAALFCVALAAAGQTAGAGGSGPGHTAAAEAAHPPAKTSADQSQQGSVPLAGQPDTSAGTAAGMPRGSSEYPQPRISIATAAPAAAPMSWQARIAWAAKIVLAILAYVGILLAVGLLRKIERQSRYMETAAVAAGEAAQAALLQAQALAAAERPWVAIEALQVAGSENEFSVMAVNRGRSPARLTATLSAFRIVRDESDLPGSPEFEKEADAPFSPILLLPGESTRVRSFSRDEVKTACKSTETMRLVESWEMRVYLYGKVQYADLISPAGHGHHESGWCCWYIHGLRKSGMVAAGPEAYHRHT
jgi:hypothetical protein